MRGLRRASARRSGKSGRADYGQSASRVNLPLGRPIYNRQSAIWNSSVGRAESGNCPGFTLPGSPWGVFALDKVSARAILSRPETKFGSMPGDCRRQSYISGSLFTTSADIGLFCV